jgi:two-component system, OmpR family, sensor kinase
MPQTAWYRSLYWRIGIGFVLFLAVVLALQGGILMWLISRMEVGPGRTPPEVSRLIARELGDALGSNPQLDIGQFLKQQYEGRIPLVVVMKDGRLISTDGNLPPPAVVNEIRSRLDVDHEPPRMGRGGRGRGFGGGPGPREGGMPPPGGPPLRRRSGSPVVADGKLVGAVIAMPLSPLRQLGPTMALVGVALIVVGTTIAAALIFGPVRSRLRSLEDAARNVGGGDLTARAREDGGDEVAALARTFNQMTKDLQARASQLQAADRTRRLLLADVSHELMTPLTGMRGYLETLSLHAQSLDPETRERYLSIIRDETQRVEHIVGDLLDLARLDSGGDSYDAQDVPVEDLFGRVVARHGRAAEEQGVTLTTDIGPGAEIVTGDPMRLEQALQNLVANALRHTPAGGFIKLNATAESGGIVVTIRDSGSGIAAEHLPHVFDRFYKVDPSRGGQAVGSGLGLSIVKAIVERHGGTIAATSRSGQGTTFTISLP